MPDKHHSKRQLSLFLRLFSPRITVRVADGYVSLESNRRSVRLGAHVYIREEKGRYGIASVGEMPKDNIPSTRIELFHSDSRSDKFECLVAFIRHSLSLVSSRFAMVRPTVICKGSKDLSSLFSGYEEGILRRAFREAGAADTYFE